MTNQPSCTLSKEILKQIAAEGMDASRVMIRLLVNEAMRLQRKIIVECQGIGERTPGTGLANANVRTNLVSNQANTNLIFGLFSLPKDLVQKNIKGAVLQQC